MIFSPVADSAVRAKSIIAVANEVVSIITALRMLGADLPEDVGTSRSHKIHCPFGVVYHSDHGVSPAMRIYTDSNSAWCFSCSAYYTPVRLVSQALDVDAELAASRLLDHAGYKPVDMELAWKRASDYEPEPDKALLAQALKTYCRRICATWVTRQFDPEIAAALTRCLAVLDLVTSDADAGLWLATCKVSMHRALTSTPA